MIGWDHISHNCSRFVRMIVLLGLLFLIHDRAMAADTPAKDTTFTVVIKRIKEPTNAIYFMKPFDGASGRVEVEDVLYVDKNTSIIVDGQRARFDTLRPGYRVTVRCIPRSPLIKTVVAVSPEEEKRVAREIEATEREVRREYNAYLAACSEKLARLQAERRAAFQQKYREQIARWQAAQRQAYMERSAAWQTRAALSSSAPTASQKQRDAIFKIVSAVMAHAVAIKSDEKDDLFSQLFSGGCRVVRDQLIESALRDVFPNLGDFSVRAVRRVICLRLDNQLTKEQLIGETVKEEIILQLKKEDPELGTVAEIADFILKLHSAKK